MTRHASAFLVLLCLAGAALAGTLRVEQKTAQVRGNPSFLSPVVGTLTQGQAVEGLRSQGDWQQVRTPSGTTGWVPNSAVVASTGALQTHSGAAMNTGAQVNTGASASEMALAGKGFGASTEAQFRSAHPNLDFAWVDRMEKAQVPRSELQRFAQAGGLTAPGGAK
jgi:uncharacterized protein YgiM (DUF1202 family)